MVLAEITSDELTGEITMKKKIVLVQIAAIYIAMIGVINAAHPEIGHNPVTVTADHFQIIRSHDIDNEFGNRSEPLTF